MPRVRALLRNMRFCVEETSTALSLHQRGAQGFRLFFSAGNGGALVLLSTTKGVRARLRALRGSFPKQLSRVSGSSCRTVEWVPLPLCASGRSIYAGGSWQLVVADIPLILWSWAQVPAGCLGQMLVYAWYPRRPHEVEPGVQS